MGAADHPAELPRLSDINGFWTEPIERRAEAFAQLRDTPGLAFFPEPKLDYVPSGPGYWALTRMDEVKEVSRNPEVFRSAQGSTGIVDTPPEFLEFYGSMINMDRPRHARLRRIVSRGFTPARMARLNHVVRSVSTAIVDDVAESGTCDAVADIAARLPLTIICELMGVPESQRQFVMDHSNVILGSADPEYVAETSDIFRALLESGAAMATLMSDLGSVRAENPTDDLVSALVSAEVDGERLSTKELASFFILLVVAGNETTRNAISWGIKALTDNPDQKAVWLDDIDAITPTAVEEIVRWASPVIFMRRTVAEPVELSGQSLAPGDKVLMFYWSANRDERYFREPELFDVRRTPNPHIGFGAPGPHVCLGMHLARLEIATIFRELLTRLPGLHATAEPQRLRSNFINGIKRLPCALG